MQPFLGQNDMPVHAIALQKDAASRSVDQKYKYLIVCFCYAYERVLTPNHKQDISP